jgi:4-hydroxy-3-polyprenylbenzoate decarboxylase
VYKDLRTFLDALEQDGDLVRVNTEVSRDLEITEIYDRTIKKGGPALLFENVSGFDIPVAINVLGTDRRMARALGAETLDELPEKIDEWLDFIKEPPVGGLIAKLKALPKLAEVGSFFPKEVKKAPVKEVVNTTNPSFNDFPVIQSWPDDGGRYITLPLVFTHDPESGKRNCGIYRMQVYDDTTSGMHWHPHKDGARHYKKSEAKKQRIEVAAVIGADPASTFCGAAPLPPDIDEMLFSGVLRKKAVEMVKCETIDVMVPAHAEIVFEGYVEPDERRLEGPFGDHTGYYSLADDFPVFHLTAVTHRKNPIYQTIVVGPPPQEDCPMGGAIERLFLPLMQMQLPEVVDYHLPYEGVFHNLMIVSIRKSYPGHARKIMNSIWGLGQAMFTKMILVVDEDVNVRDYREVAWKALNNIDPERDMQFTMGPLDILDHASRICGYGSKVGVDATTKWKGEGFDREWPDVIEMSPDVKAKIDGLWDELGITLPE